MNEKKDGLSLGRFLIIVFVFYFMFTLIISNLDVSKKNNSNRYTYSDSVFSIITTPENKVLEDTIKDYAKKWSNLVKEVPTNILEVNKEISNYQELNNKWNI